MLPEIFIRKANSSDDLKGVFELQKRNLARSLDGSEMLSQGFVTVDHTLDQLSDLQSIRPHIVAEHQGGIVGYVLAMTAMSCRVIPVLEPMFEIFNQLSWMGQPLSTYQYMVCGQVCVAKEHRGTGLFRALYKSFQQHYSQEFDLCITEIDMRNTRSLQAHKNIGFKVIHQYRGEDGRTWLIVAWDWRPKAFEVKVIEVSNDDTRFLKLVDKLNTYLATINGDADDFFSQLNRPSSLDFALVLEEENQAVACGGWRSLDQDTVEIKRMFVKPEARHKGFARRLLKALEAEALERGMTLAVLETSMNMQDAIALYQSAGYSPIANYGAYQDVPTSRCFSKILRK